MTETFPSPEKTLERIPVQELLFSEFSAFPPQILNSVTTVVVSGGKAFMTCFGY